MHTLLTVIGILALIAGVIPLYMTRRFRHYVTKRLARAPMPYQPRVSVVVPCKGTDLEFEQNILAFLSQDYPAYEVLFVTATMNDPARAELERITALHHGGPSVRLLTAGIHRSRGQKITNLLAGVANASVDSEVLVFWDADIRVRPNFIMDLVAPLADPSVGVTTGFPWYLPVKGNAGSVLRSIWGGGALPLLVDEKRNFASGACNAIRKSVFEQAQVARAMDRSISDTFAITNSVRAMGLAVEFVPQCLAVTSDESSLVQTLKWTNRQTIISRVYSPPFWWMVAVSYSFSNAVVVLGLLLLLSGITSGNPAETLPALLMLGLVPLEIINAAMMIPVVKKLLPEDWRQLDALLWKYYLLTPLASVLIMINSIASRTTNVIEWRGVHYRLVSPEQTDVLDADNMGTLATPLEQRD